MSRPEFVVVNPVLGRIQSPKALVLSFSSLSQRGVGRGVEPVRNAYTGVQPHSELQTRRRLPTLSEQKERRENGRGSSSYQCH